MSSSRHDMFKMAEDLDYEGRCIAAILKDRKENATMADTKQPPAAESVTTPAAKPAQKPTPPKQPTPREIAARRKQHRSKFKGKHPLDIGTKVKLRDTAGAITSPQRAAKIMDFIHGDHQYKVQFEDSKGVTVDREVPPDAAI